MALYLVTGVAGFIGSSIARALLAKGQRVRGIDNLVTGHLENIADLDGLEFQRGDVSDPECCREACHGVDYVFHEAAIASVPRSIADPVETNTANITGTLELLVASRDAGVKRFIYAGSSAAYGQAGGLKCNEQMTPDPISPYAVSKLTGEYYLSSFARVYGMETVTLRYFNVFGPKQDPNSMYSGVLARFIMLMLRGEQPTIFGDGEQTRDFTFVENVVNANVLACHAPRANVAGKVFNVATGTSVSLNRAYQLLQKIIGIDIEPRFEPERAGDIKHSGADISAARSFGYAPTVEFEEGLARTVEWYKTRARAPEMKT